MLDLLNTKEYQIHHAFFFSCTIATALSLLIASILWLYIDFVYIFFHSLLHTHPIVWYTFVSFTVLNNLYQTYAHIFTATTFGGLHIIIPWGSKKNQTLSSFTMSNSLDIIGWLCIFVYLQRCPLVPGLLAATHYGSGIISIFFNKTFQTYYIDSVKDIRKQNIQQDTFGYTYWKTFKILFVLTDAFTRLGYVGLILISK